MSRKNQKTLTNPRRLVKNLLINQIKINLTQNSVENLAPLDLAESHFLEAGRAEDNYTSNSLYRKFFSKINNIKCMLILAKLFDSTNFAAKMNLKI